MQSVLISLAATLLALLLPVAAEAGCVWEWVRNDSGDCRHVSICDSAIEIAPVEPPSIRPVVPPSIEPIAPPRVPPVGTSQCVQVRRQDASGSWYWDTVCH